MANNYVKYQNEIARALYLSGTLPQSDATSREA